MLDFLQLSFAKEKEIEGKRDIFSIKYELEDNTFHLSTDIIDDSRDTAIV